MPLETNRIRLEVPNKDDLPRFFEIYGNPRNNLFNPAGPIATIQHAEVRFDKLCGHWEKYSFGPWKLIEKSSGEVMGYGGLNFMHYGETLHLNLGYRLDEAYWGNGYATEVAQFAMNYGLKELDQKAIFGLVRPDHITSIRVLEKCGMILYDDLDDFPGLEKSLIYRFLREDKK